MEVCVSDPDGLANDFIRCGALGYPLPLERAWREAGMPVFNRRHRMRDQFVYAAFASMGHALNGLNRQGVARIDSKIRWPIVAWAERLQWPAEAHERQQAEAGREWNVARRCQNRKWRRIHRCRMRVVIPLKSQAPDRCPKMIVFASVESSRLFRVELGAAW